MSKAKIVKIQKKANQTINFEAKKGEPVIIKQDFIKSGGVGQLKLKKLWVQSENSNKLLGILSSVSFK